MTKVNLHIGPHKTATTRIQACLGDAQERLAEQGIEYRTIKQITRLFKGKLQGAGLGRISVEDALDVIRPRLETPVWQCDNLVLSFENIVGVSRHVLIPGDGGYAQLDNRLGLMAGLFKDRDVTIFMATRRYDKFLDSAYSEAVRARFDQTASALGMFLSEDHLRWTSFVERTRALFPEAKLVMWQHEDYRANEAAILARLSGADAKMFSTDLPNDDYRVSLSRDAVTALLAVHPYTEFKNLRDGQQQMAEALAQAFPSTAENPAVTLWDDAQREALKERYAADIATLRARSDVEFLSFD